MIETDNLGKIVVQPQIYEASLAQQANLIICPHRMTITELEVLERWANSSQTPILCQSKDVDRLHKEGVSAYRFHRLDGFRSMDFRGGSIEFFPVKKEYKTLFSNIYEKLFVKNSESVVYHFVVKPIGEDYLAFLCSPYVSNIDWYLMNLNKGLRVAGSCRVPDSQWDIFEKEINKKIERTFGSVLSLARSSVKLKDSLLPTKMHRNEAKLNS